MVSERKIKRICYEILMHESEILNNRYSEFKEEDMDEVLNTSYQIIEIARSSLVLRVFNKTYNVTEDVVAYESVGAHVNLVMSLIDRTLNFIFGQVLGSMNYRKIMEAIRRHDLPENDIGDIPDNGERNNEVAARAERYYLLKFSSFSPGREEDFEEEVMDLLDQMDKKSTESGRIMYLADKISAIVMVLCYELTGLAPTMSIDSDYASELDREAMDICDYEKDGEYRASEMWTIDYFKTREIVKYDTTGYLTAILIMTTLIINEKWYTWREKDYPKHE